MTGWPKQLCCRKKQLLNPGVRLRDLRWEQSTGVKTNFTESNLKHAWQVTMARTHLRVEGDFKFSTHGKTMLNMYTSRSRAAVNSVTTNGQAFMNQVVKRRKSFNSLPFCRKQKWRETSPSQLSKLQVNVLNWFECNPEWNSEQNKTKPSNCHLKICPLILHQPA